MPLRSRTAPRSTTLLRLAMSLAFDIGQGAGLAGATGVRPFLPPLLTGALASGDIGVDFDGTTLRLGRVARLPARRARARGRRLRARAPAPQPRAGSGGADRRSRPSLAVIAMVLGAVLFGASLAEGGETEWPGVIAGMLCAFLGFLAVAMLFARARARLEGGAARAAQRLRRRTSLVIAGARDPVPAARLRGARRLRGAARPRRAAAATRSTRACASSVERARGAEEARPRGDRRAQARDARARDRAGPRARARGDHEARHLRARAACRRSRR